MCASSAWMSRANTTERKHCYNRTMLSLNFPGEHRRRVGLEVGTSVGTGLGMGVGAAEGSGVGNGVGA